jgi:hypothetical protein
LYFSFGIRTPEFVGVVGFVGFVRFVGFVGFEGFEGFSVDGAAAASLGVVEAVVAGAVVVVGAAVLVDVFSAVAATLVSGFGTTGETTLVDPAATVAVGAAVVVAFAASATVALATGGSMRSGVCDSPAVGGAGIDGRRTLEASSMRSAAALVFMKPAAYTATIAAELNVTRLFATFFLPAPEPFVLGLWLTEGSRILRH